MACDIALCVTDEGTLIAVDRDFRNFDLAMQRIVAAWMHPGFGSDVVVLAHLCRHTVVANNCTVDDPQSHCVLDKMDPWTAIKAEVWHRKHAHHVPCLCLALFQIQTDSCAMAVILAEALAGMQDRDYDSCNTPASSLQCRD